MTADTITVARISDIQATLEIALDTVNRLDDSDTTPAEAAAILNETLANIQSAFR